MWHGQGAGCGVMMTFGCRPTAVAGGRRGARGPNSKSPRGEGADCFWCDCWDVRVPGGSGGQAKENMEKHHHISSVYKMMLISEAANLLANDVFNMEVTKWKILPPGSLPVRRLGKLSIKERNYNCKLRCRTKRTFLQ